jgi:hypothetical protein
MARELLDGREVCSRIQEVPNKVGSHGVRGERLDLSPLRDELHALGNCLVGHPVVDDLAALDDGEKKGAWFDTAMYEPRFDGITSTSCEKHSSLPVALPDELHGTGLAVYAAEVNPHRF